MWQHAYKLQRLILHRLTCHWWTYLL